MARQCLCDSCGDVMLERGICGNADHAVVIDAPRDLGCDAVRVRVSVALRVLNNDEASPDLCERCLVIITINALAADQRWLLPTISLPPAPALAVRL